MKTKHNCCKAGTTSRGDEPMCKCECHAEPEHLRLFRKLLGVRKKKDTIWHDDERTYFKTSSGAICSFKNKKMVK